MARIGIRGLAAGLTAVCIAAAILPASGQAVPAHATAVTKVTIAMGYIPDVQFTPFYVASARGYYKAAGLDVHYDYTLTSDVIKVVGTGSSAFGDAEADQVIVGVERGLPVVSVFAQYQRFPVVIFALKSSGIKTFADLKGKTIGIPGLYGASYTGLLAALAAAHLTQHDVKIEAIGYAQVAAVATKRVDAAVGYAMNEPVQLSEQGYAVTSLPIAVNANLAGPGVITSRSMIAKQPAIVAAFVKASLHGLQDTIADPVAAFAIARRYLPSLSSSQAKYQLAVLQKAIQYWTPYQTKALGCNNPAQWTATQSILLTQHQVTKAGKVSTMYTNHFLAKC
jgi:NitT/TauT family transport system substrate-binding protein